MHDAKVEVYIPLSTPCSPDGIEFTGDVKGVEMSVMIEGGCAFRISINESLELKVVRHSNGNELFAVDLEKLYDEE